MIFKKETIEQLSKELKLSYTGTEQDWDIEMANSKRINDFIKFYIQSDLSLDRKVAVMSLILASYEDFLNENNLGMDDRWEIIKSELKTDLNSFVDLINYWSIKNEANSNNLFRITPLLRKL